MKKTKYRGIGTNLILAGDGFYVSYNEYDTAIYGCDTTALVVGQMEKFYILNGDHREKYSSLIERGFDACMSYFQENISLINIRSDNPPSVYEGKEEIPSI